MSDEPDNVIDLRPLIARRKASQCSHLHIEVADDVAEIECTDCGAELDPWQVLRESARRWESEEAWRQSVREDFVRWVERNNEIIARQNEEIATLTAAKNRLWNEQVNGRPLGAQVDRRKDRRR